MPTASGSFSPGRLTSVGARLICVQALGTRLSRLLSYYNHRILFKEGPLHGGEAIMAKHKFRPLHDRVVVKRVSAEEKSKGGIIIPDTAKEKPQEGEVVAVGPGGRDETGKLTEMTVKAGDRVLFGKWSGTEVKLEGDELLIMKESDIMGVLV
jgi:chaperonin GroES